MSIINTITDRLEDETRGFKDVLSEKVWEVVESIDNKVFSIRMHKHNKQMQKSRENREMLITLLVSQGYFEIKGQSDILNYLNLLPKTWININWNMYKRYQLKKILWDIIEWNWKNQKDFLDKITIIALAIDQAKVLNK